MASRYYGLLALGIAAFGLLVMTAINVLKPAARPKNIQKKYEHAAPSVEKISPLVKRPAPTRQGRIKVPVTSIPQDEPASRLLKLDIALSSEHTPESPVMPEALPEKRCFNIEKIEIEVPENLPEHVRAAGVSTLPQDRFYFVHAALEKHTGECIGRDELNLILKELTTLIFDKGYTTTRVAIPEQNLSSGTLKISLIPGLIHDIRFAPEDSGASWKTASPARAGDVLNLRDLEQGLEQMKRVPSQDVDMQIIPAARAGESDVVVNVKQNRAWKWTATLDDSGASGTGKYQASLNLAVDKLFGINDLFNMGINNDAGNRGGNRGTRGNNAYYSMPYGNWTFTLAGSNYQYHQRIAGTYQTFVSSGDSNNLELKMAYLLHRDQYSKTSIQARTAKRWNSSFIDDTEIDVQKRNNTLAEISLTHKHNIGAAQFEITAAQRAGVHWFGAQADLENRLETDPTFFYEMSVLDLSLSIPFKLAGRPYKYLHTLRAQSSQSSLYATEYISMGNRWTVRGFDGETSLAAERGWFIRNEFETPLAESGHAAYIGLDMGMVYGNNVPNLVGDHLVGVAIGARGSLFKGMYYDLFSGWPLYKPKQYPSAEPAAGFSLTYQF
jgi:hemolysin activation/secretion protein